MPGAIPHEYAMPPKVRRTSEGAYFYERQSRRPVSSAFLWIPYPLPDTGTANGPAANRILLTGASSLKIESRLRRESAEREPGSCPAGSSGFAETKNPKDVPPARCNGGSFFISCLRENSASDRRTIPQHRFRRTLRDVSFSENQLSENGPVLKVHCQKNGINLKINCQKNGIYLKINSQKNGVCLTFHK